MSTTVQLRDDRVDARDRLGRTGSADQMGQREFDRLSGTELMKHWGVTMRALRFYESRGLISPRRDGRGRVYGQRDSDRIGLILQAKKYGFTLAEIGRLIDVTDGAATSGGLQLTAQECLRQIGHLEGQMKNLIEALADLRRLHLELCRKAGSAGDKVAMIGRV